MVSLSHRRSYVEYGKNINLFVCIILKFKLKKKHYLLNKNILFFDRTEKFWFLFFAKN